MPVSSSMSIADCLEFARALLGIEGDLVVAKDGQRLVGATLSEAGVQHGDLLVVMKALAARTPAPQPPSASRGLDFSNLLGRPSAPSTSTSAPNGGGLDFANLLTSASSQKSNQIPVYYPGMHLEDAMDHNPHPEAIVKMLQMYV